MLQWAQEASGRRPRTRELQRVPCPCQAMNLLHELQFAREFEKAVQEAYPELLLALLTQTHYISELNLPEEPQPGQEAQPLATPSPQR